MSDVVAADGAPVALYRAVAPIAHGCGRGLVPARTPPASGRISAIGPQLLLRRAQGAGRDRSRSGRACPELRRRTEAATRGARGVRVRTDRRWSP